MKYDGAINRKNKFVKLLKKDMVHNGHKFCMGLNVDYGFDVEVKECEGGGIYFCVYEKYHMWLAYGYKIMWWICDVEVPIECGAKMVKYGDKFKANKVILSNLRSLEDELDPIYRRIVVGARGKEEVIVRAFGRFSPYCFDRRIVRMMRKNKRVVEMLKEEQLTELICLVVVCLYPEYVRCISDEKLHRLNVLICRCGMVVTKNDREKLVKVLEERKVYDC